MKIPFLADKPKLPTDLEILECIYNEYYKEFISYTKTSRAAKMYVPVDFDLIGNKLGVDGDIPFGRLYYFLNSKYRIEHRVGDFTQLFEKVIGYEEQKSRNAVQFTLLASILSELKIEHRKHSTNITIAWMSLAVSAIALVISLLSKNLC